MGNLTQYVVPSVTIFNSKSVFWPSRILSVEEDNCYIRLDSRYLTLTFCRSQDLERLQYDSAAVAD